MKVLYPLVSCFDRSDVQLIVLNKWKHVNSENQKRGSWIIRSSRRRKKRSGRDSQNKLNLKKLVSDNGNRGYSSHLTRYLTLQLIAERDRLNKDLEATHASIKQLEADLETMAAPSTGSRSKR